MMIGRVLTVTLVTNREMTEEEAAQGTMMTRRGTMMTRSDMAIVTAIGEMTATEAVVMTEDIAAATTIVGATVIPDIVATGKPVYKCILMAGISLIWSLVVGHVWIK